MQIVNPSPELEIFTCPRCHTLAEQRRGTLSSQEKNTPFGSLQERPSYIVRTCWACLGVSIFHDNSLIYPESTVAPAPNEDMLKDIQIDYMEASGILQKSPRGSAALLRLCVQKLCKQLGEHGGNIDKDIKSLVSKGLPITVQQALDTVRVIGNEAVHPGTIDLNDTPEIALKLFGLVNLIAQIMITQPREIAELYGSLPQNKLDAITRRDAT